MKRIVLLSVSRLIGIAFLAACEMTTAVAEQDWWTMSDQAFAKAYADTAFSDDIDDQSTVAWMLFARLNQPQDYQGKTVSTWELWPSNADTFNPALGDFVPQSKVRPRPHLEMTKFEQATGRFHTFPDSAGEERTRNMLSYRYIRGNGLITKSGVNAYLSRGNTVDVPIGSVEVKADWSNNRVEGAYQFADETTGSIYSLLGLHIMAKLRPTPADPYTSEDPSWFWTTFEFYGNPGLEHVQTTLITYPDPLSNGARLLAEAGLDGTAFTNYSSNGTQIRFADDANSKIVLGNTKMEDFAGFPNPDDPAGWTSFNSSCHTCHVTAAYSADQGKYFSFNPQIGTGELPRTLMKGYKSLDFIWSISFNAR